jgi:hypothetical protein
VANFPDLQDSSDDTPFEAMKNNTMSKAGYAYLLGDAALFAAGAMKGQWKEASTGALWGIAGLFPAIYGDPKAETQLELMSHRLGQHFKKQGIDIPESPTTELLARPHGAWQQMEEFFYTYPSQMLNAVYAIGSTTLIASGLKKGNKGDTAAGLLVMAGALAGLLVQEKKPDPDHPPTTTLGKVSAWFQEKPLRISSAFYWANNVGLLAGALQDKKTNPANKGYMLKYLTVASYVFGNLMLSMSSKGHGGEGGQDHTAMEKLAESAAHVIASQPKETQEALLQQVAGFLTTDPMAQGMSAAEISTMLSEKLHQTAGKSVNAGWQQRLYDHNGLPTTPQM